MRLLALETGGDYCSVALWQDGALCQHQQHTPRQQHQHLLPLFDALLAEAGITLAAVDVLAFGQGPGAFTGVRIAASVMQALALAKDLPVVAVSSLAALAHGAYRHHGASAVLAALDARMHQVYWASYKVLAPGLVEAVGSEGVYDPESVPLPLDRLLATPLWTGAGSGWQAYPEALALRCARVPELALAAVWPTLHPESWDVAQLAASAWLPGSARDTTLAMPVYLRDRVVHLPTV